MAMPTNMQDSDGRFIKSLTEHVRTQNPDMPEDTVLREARKLYDGPVYPPSLGPVELHLRDLQPRNHEGNPVPFP